MSEGYRKPFGYNENLFIKLPKFFSDLLIFWLRNLDGNSSLCYLCFQFQVECLRTTDSSREERPVAIKAQDVNS